MDYYEELGIGRNATQEEIKSAYRKKAFQWHPDRNPGDKNAETMFKIIQNAYDVLSNPLDKANYDGKGRTYTYAYKKPSYTAPKKPAKPAKKVYSSDRFSIHDAPPPKYDLWGRPLSEDEQKEWQFNNSTHMKDVLRKQKQQTASQWKDSMSDQYYSGGAPDIR